MAADTVGEVGDAFFTVLALDLGSRVAPITGVRSQAGGVACPAIFGAPMPKRERVSAIEFRRDPGGGGMAGYAV